MSLHKLPISAPILKFQQKFYHNFWRFGNTFWKRSIASLAASQLDLELKRKNGDDGIHPKGQIEIEFDEESDEVSNETNFGLGQFSRAGNL